MTTDTQGSMSGVRLGLQAISSLIVIALSTLALRPEIATLARIGWLVVLQGVVLTSLTLVVYNKERGTMRIVLIVATAVVTVCGIGILALDLFLA